MSNKRKKDTLLVLKRESGMIGVLALFMVLAVLTFIIVLGIKSVIVRRASADLRFRAHQVCANLASGDLFIVRHEALSTFRRLLDGEFGAGREPLGDGFAYLKEVKLIIPNMPDFSRFDPVGRTSDLPFLDVNLDGVSDLSGAPVSFTELGLASCSGLAGMAAGSDCMYSAQVGDERFPAPFWDNLEHAGLIVGCYFKGGVRTAFDWTDSEEPEIEAAFAFWKPVRGFFPEHLPSSESQGASAEFATMPGLTIAVSTHMTTDARDSRFRFPSGEWQLEDPLHGFTISNPLGEPNFYDDSADSHCLPSDPSSCLVPPRRVSATFRSAEWYVDSSGQESDRANPSGSIAATPTDYEEMRVACMNPAVLVRNGILTTIMELAVRHGQLRASTELLHIGTQHRDLCDPSVGCKSCGAGETGCSPDVERLHSKPSLPATIVPFGKDLLRPDMESGVGRGAYQIPYVSFHGGEQLNLDTPHQFGPALGGIVDPFNTPGSSDPLQRYHSLVAGQLRYCTHLYQCSFAYDSPAPACPEQHIGRFFPDLIYNPKFESEDYQPVSALSAGGALASWDQSCPWGGADARCSRGGGVPSGRPKLSGLTAAELVAALGTTQICPYRKFAPSFFPAHGICEKPSFASGAGVTFDLRPDYRALISYIAGSSQRIASPGLFPERPDYSWQDDPSGRVFTPDNYSSRINPYTPLLLVTHLAPLPEEVEVIRGMLSSNTEWQTRPITVVFIPTASVQVAQVGQWQRALFAEPGDSGFRNRVFLLSPFSEEIDWPAGLSEAEKFQLYWLELIDPREILTQDRSLVWRTFHIFNSLITRVERKL